MTARKIVGVFAHPDDESLLAGGTLARFVAERAEAAVLMTGHVLFRRPWPVLARLWSEEHFARHVAAPRAEVARDLFGSA